MSVVNQNVLSAGVCMKVLEFYSTAEIMLIINYLPFETLKHWRQRESSVPFLHSSKYAIDVGQTIQSANQPTGCRLAATVHAAFIGTDIEKQNLSLVRAGLRPRKPSPINQYRGENCTCHKQLEI